MEQLLLAPEGKVTFFYPEGIRYQWLLIRWQVFGAPCRTFGLLWSCGGHCAGHYNCCSPIMARCQHFTALFFVQYHLHSLSPLYVMSLNLRHEDWYKCFIYSWVLMTTYSQSFEQWEVSALNTVLYNKRFLWSRLRAAQGFQFQELVCLFMYL